MKTTNHDGDSFESMRDASDQPLAVIGQGDSRRTIEHDDIDEDWLDVLICACIIGGLALIFILVGI